MLIYGDIPVHAFKFPKCLLAYLLSDVINHCMCDGVFLDNLNIAKVVPIFKWDECEIRINHRPISVLAYLRKIFENVVRKPERYFPKNNLLSQQLDGFLSNHSTSLAITGLNENLFQNLDKKNFSCAVYLYLAKAFDTANHSILLKTWAMRRKRKCV